MSHSKHPRTPSLSARMIALENRRHAKRLKDIKTLEARLAQLEPVINTIEKRHGIVIDPNGIKSDLLRRIDLGALWLESERIRNTLLEMGFIEAERRDYPSFYVSDLKKGRLILIIYVERPSQPPVICTTP